VETLEEHGVPPFTFAPGRVPPRRAGSNCALKPITRTTRARAGPAHISPAKPSVAFVSILGACAGELLLTVYLYAVSILSSLSTRRGGGCNRLTRPEIPSSVGRNTLSLD
jgi:hypothetical protein